MIRLRGYYPVLAALCAVSVSPPAVAAGPSSRTKLRVDVYNLASLSSRNIHLSTEEAGRVMREVGVEVIWQFPGSQSPPQHTLNLDRITTWDLSEDVDPFIVRILPTAPKDLPATLGYSLPAEPDWIHAVIFDNHVEEVHDRNRVSFASLLGYAIAHELTHMVLKSGQHSVRGVMKACWERPDLLDIACGRLQFNPEEGASISRAALRRLSKHRRS
jgi:hypothetical protein